MRRLGTLTVLLVLALWSTTALAQKQYNIWYFGHNRGLDFTFTPPKVLVDGKTESIEGSAVYCDPMSGQLLFYTDGKTVWDRQHNIMPNGQGLVGDQSSTQSSLIIPDPSNDKRYYIFHSDQSGYIAPSKGLHYSICDMRLNNGFGDITTKNIELHPSTTEKLTAIPFCDGRAYWIISHEMYNNTFIAWYLDNNGLSNTPVRSRVGVDHGPQAAAGAGYLAASPDGTMLASAVALPESVEIYKFDQSSGQVFSPLSLPTPTFSYGISFSPNNRMLYVCGENEVDQFDISSWNRADIIATRVRMNNGNARVGAIKIGPDRKLYIQHGDRVGVVSKPDVSGVGCEYDPNALSMQGTIGMYGLPNNIDAQEGGGCKRPLALIREHSTNICEARCLDFYDSSRYGPTNFLWAFEGATPSVSTDRNPKNICFSKEGTYTVKLMVWNEYGRDSTTSTIQIKSCPIPQIALRDTTICISECLTFRDTSSISTTTQWLFDEGKPASYTGKTPPEICYYRIGKHRVRVIVGNQYGYDTAIAYVTVENCDKPVAAFTHDTVICAGSTLSLTDKSRNNITTWDWTFNGGIPSSSTEQHPKDIVYNQVGLYEIRLIVSNKNGSDTAYSKVRVTECLPPVAVLRDYEICQGDCIYLEDSSTNDPVSWEWQLEGIIPGFYTSSKPGQICYETPGRFSIQLISRNLYGADTVRSNVLVRPATGFARSSLNLADGISACTTIDTAFWVYAGCKNNVFGLLSSNDPNILLSTNTVTIPANDSLRVPVQIVGQTPGNYSANISFSLNGEAMGVLCNYSVQPDGEKFVLSAMDADFVTAHCESMSKELTIINSSCSEQEIIRIYLDATSGATPFSISYDGNALKILPEHSIQVSITYDPVLAGDSDPDLVIETKNGTKHICPLRGVRMPLPELSVMLRSATHSATAGDKVGLELAFESAVGDTALPNTIDLTMDYNTDLLSIDEVRPQNGWLLLSKNESGGKLSLSFDRQQISEIAAGETLAEVTFRTYLAKEDSTPVALSSVICNAGNAQFSTCVLSAGYTGAGSIHVGALCGDSELKKILGNEKLLSVIVQPNPVSVSGKLLLIVNTLGIGETLELDLVDLSGKRVELQGIIVQSTQEQLEIALPNLPAGSYTLRARMAGEQITEQIILY